MSDFMQKRVNAALHGVVNAWLPPHTAEGDLARAKYTRRRRTLQELHPELVRQLDELVLAVTADTAAKIEALQQNAAPKLAQANRAHLHVVPLGALADYDTGPCAGSGAAVSTRDAVRTAADPHAVLGTTWCSECDRPAPAERATPRARIWRIATHYRPTNEGA